MLGMEELKEYIVITDTTVKKRKKKRLVILSTIYRLGWTF
jgi:hypothetical protein